MPFRYDLVWILAIGLSGTPACGRWGYSAVGDADAGADAGGAERCAPGEILCGDFEDGPGNWILRGDNGGSTTLGVVTSPVAVGGGALRIRTGLDGDGFAAAEHIFAPVRDGTLYGRVMLWVGLTTAIDEYLVAVQLDDGDDGGLQKLSIDLLPFDNVIVTATTANPTVRPGSAPGFVRRHEWMCLTFRIELSQTNGTIEMFERDRPAVMVRGIDTVPDPGGYHRMLLAAVAPSPAIGELVFDAVALGREPLPCP